MRTLLAGLVLFVLPVSGAVSAAPAGPAPVLQFGVTVASTDAAGGSYWQWPTDAAHAVYRPFIAPATPYGPGHRGVDLAAGAELRAPADGTVSFAGVVVDRGVLSIDHGGGVVSSYEPVTTDLKAGDTVRTGDVIGRIDAGHCSERCVHVGVRIAGEYVSPLLFLGGVPRAVLLPTRAAG
jgi:murein DD-endopeptidase MepM/ murein hydrolase activator NlpD